MISASFTERIFLTRSYHSRTHPYPLYHKAEFPYPSRNSNNEFQGSNAVGIVNIGLSLSDCAQYNLDVCGRLKSRAKFCILLLTEH